MDEIRSFFEGIAVPVVMSLSGGLAKAAGRGFGSWRQFVASLFVSGFTGVVVHLFIKDADISASMSAALVGLSGYSGVAILDGLAACMQKFLERVAGHPFPCSTNGQNAPKAAVPGEDTRKGRADA